MARAGLAADLARELGVATAVAGMTQRELAAKVRVSRSRIGRVLTGRAPPSIELAQQIAAATGHRLIVRVAPGDGIRLRDSGQMSLAEVLRSQAHPTWQIRLEVPVARFPDRRAADLVMSFPGAVVMVELERWIRDFQAQLRAAQLKRVAFSERTGGPVQLVIGLPDARSKRRLLHLYADLVAESLPVASRRAWAAIRSGTPLEGDALLWIPTQRP